MQNQSKALKSNVKVRVQSLSQSDETGFRTDMHKKIAGCLGKTAHTAVSIATKTILDSLNRALEVVGSDPSLLR